MWPIKNFEKCFMTHQYILKYFMTPAKALSPSSYILNVWSLNTDHAMFFMLGGKPVLSFSKTFSRYQNSKILSCLNVIALSNFYIYIRSLQV